MKTHTLTITAAAFAGALSLGTGPAAAEYPEDNINLIVPWPAGGGQDTVGRLVGEHLDRQLPVSVVVSNTPGAAGATGVREIEESEPDGYTIGTLGLHVIAQTYINPNASELDNIDPLVMVNTNPAAISVRPGTGIETLEEFVEYASENPGAIVNGNDSPGGFSFLTAELMEDHLDVELSKIPYQGYAPTVSALLSDEIMSATLPVPVVADLHESGEVIMLAVASEERNPAAPDVPTFQELGYDFVFADNVMIFGPVGIPEDVKATLEGALLDAMQTDEFIEAGTAAGLTLEPLGSEEATAMFRQMDDDVYPVLLESGLVEVRER